MKKNIIKFTIAACLVLFYSCEDAIDIEQVGRVTDDVAFETVQDLQDGLTGVYGQFDMTKEVAMAANFTDEVAEGTENGGQGRTTGAVFNLNAGSAAAEIFWEVGYRELNAVNRVIAAADLVIPADATETAEKNNILGQAYALRAFSHFQLLSYFTTDYTDDNALAVIKLDFVPSVADKLLRSTNGEIYASINADLVKATNLIEDTKNPILVSQDFVLALRARMAAYRQDYATAQTLAQDLINRYPLASRINYRFIFTDNSNEEIIFKLQRDINGIFDNQPGAGTVGAAGWIGGVFAFVNTGASGGSYYEFNRNLFNLFDSEDIRYDVCLNESESIIAPDYTSTTNYRAEDVLLVSKYPGVPGQPLLNDHKVFRSAEMLLIVAEAKAHNNDLTGAATAIKMLRDARFGSAQALAVYSSQQEAFAAILDERRVEFAFEGHRWKDIKRLGARANQGVSRDAVDVAEFGMTQTLAPDDYRFTLPLPLVEFNANPDLRAQQNPGYNN
jgi:hypothetical protein